MSTLRMLGIFFVAFGVIDFACYYALHIDLTGVAWSPYAAGLIGGLLLKKARRAPSRRTTEPLTQT